MAHDCKDCGNEMGTRNSILDATGECEQEPFCWRCEFEEDKEDNNGF